MKVIGFYNGHIPNSQGHFFEEIMGWSHGFMEADHDWVQWVFPTNEPSQFSWEAPLLSRKESELFSVDIYLQKKAIRAFEKMLGFLGLSLVDGVVDYLAPTPERPSPQHVLSFFNHNMLRITRVLKSMRMMGLPGHSNALYQVLMERKDQFSQNTLSYWEGAVFGEIWK